MSDEPEIIVTACGCSEEVRDTLQQVINHALKQNEYRDMLGLPRIGREPDYMNGRWCIGCHNSLPMDWQGPCDVCGKATSNVGTGTFAGLLYDEGKS